MNINPIDIIIAAGLCIAVIAAVIITIRRKKKGKGCSCGCENCNMPCDKNKS